YLNFAVWVGSTHHGVLTGTDSLVLLYASAIALDVGAVGLRVTSGGKPARPAPPVDDARDVRRREREARRTSGAQLG
ncbi:MAG: hypothetical protein QOE43_686, partial [Gaiellaceae bacterium]|nr:hypothetical protein [Gaiellaceae bacterium]